MKWEGNAHAPNVLHLSQGIDVKICCLMICVGILILSSSAILGYVGMEITGKKVRKLGQGGKKKVAVTLKVQQMSVLFFQKDWERH